MPLVFAYGSNMDVAAMGQRCPRSRALGVARLMRRRFAIMPQGWGNVVADPNAIVHGVLWEIALADMRALDAYEQVGQGLYRKILQPVMKAGGGSARAIVYIGKGEGGTPRAEYISAILQAARAWELPQAYIRYLATFAPGGRDMEAGAASVSPGKITTRYATPFDRR